MESAHGGLDMGAVNHPLYSILESNENGAIPKYSLITRVLNYTHQCQARGFPQQYFLNPTLCADDAVYLCYVFLIFILLRGCLSGAVGFGLDKHPALFKMLAERLKVGNLNDRQRFAENMWFGIWHTVSLFWSFFTLIDALGTSTSPGWLRLHIGYPDGRWYWMATVQEVSVGSAGWPLLFASNSVRLYFLTAFAFFLSCVVYLNFETRRSDFLAMVVHHIAATFLVGVSYILSYWKIGLVVVFLHDLSDVFLYFGKALSIIKVRWSIRDAFQYMFVATFIFGRLILYPLFCVIPALNIKVISEVSHQSFTSHMEIPGGVALPGFQVVLLMVNCYWIVCIFQSLKRRSQKRNAEGKVSSQSTIQMAETSKLD